MKIMNRTEMIKAGLVGKRVITNPWTGEKLVIDFDDSENIGVYEGEESKALARIHGGEIVSPGEAVLIHTPGDEFEDLEFLKEYGIDINKLMNEDYE